MWKCWCNIFYANVPLYKDEDFGSGVFVICCWAFWELPKIWAGFVNMMLPYFEYFLWLSVFCLWRKRWEGIRRVKDGINRPRFFITSGTFNLNYVIYLWFFLAFELFAISIIVCPTNFNLGGCLYAVYMK